MEDKVFRDAQKQVKKKKGFYVHFAVFLSVGLFFFLMNVFTTPGELWFFFPLLPWFMGIAIHYLTTFGFPGSGILTAEWEKRELEQELYRRGYFQQDGRQMLPPQTPVEDDELDLGSPLKSKSKAPGKRISEDDFV